MIPDRRSLGKKHRCECGCKFYDLGKEVPVCPRCGKVFERVENVNSSEPLLSIDEPAVDDLPDIEFGEDELEEEGVKMVSLSEVEEEEEESEEEGEYE